MVDYSAAGGRRWFKAYERRKNSPGFGASEMNRDPKLDTMRLLGEVETPHLNLNIPTTPSKEELDDACQRLATMTPYQFQQAAKAGSFAVDAVLADIQVLVNHARFG